VFLAECINAQALRQIWSCSMLPVLCAGESFVQHHRVRAFCNWLLPRSLMLGVSGHLALHVHVLDSSWRAPAAQRMVGRGNWLTACPITEHILAFKLFLHPSSVAASLV